MGQQVQQEDLDNLVMMDAQEIGGYLVKMESGDFLVKMGNPETLVEMVSQDKEEIKVKEVSLVRQVNQDAMDNQDKREQED